jgi:uncharacterized protein YndB with AHSA1/START domain
MGRLQQEIVVAAPPEAVFAFLADPERLPEWSTGVLSVRRTSSGPVGVGSTSEIEVEAFGVRQTLIGRCLTYEPHRRLAVENRTARGVTVGAISVGGVVMVSATELVPESTGTRLRTALDYTIQVPPFVRPMAEAFAEPRIRADFEQSLRNLKRVLDGQPGSG